MVNQIWDRPLQLLVQNPGTVLLDLKFFNSVAAEIHSSAILAQQDPVWLALSLFDKIYKKHAYRHPVRYQHCVWGSLFEAMEPVLQSDPQGILHAELTTVIKHVMEAIY